MYHGASSKVLAHAPVMANKFRCSRCVGMVHQVTESFTATRAPTRIRQPCFNMEDHRQFHPRLQLEAASSGSVNTGYAHHPQTKQQPHITTPTTIITNTDQNYNDKQPPSNHTQPQTQTHHRPARWQLGPQKRPPLSEHWHHNSSDKLQTTTKQPALECRRQASSNQ